jgi:heterodisulfide reductase subunit A-like polyferredoxin
MVAHWILHVGVANQPSTAAEAAQAVAAQAVAAQAAAAAAKAVRNKAARDQTARDQTARDQTARGKVKRFRCDGCGTCMKKKEFTYVYVASPFIATKILHISTCSNSERVGRGGGGRGGGGRGGVYYSVHSNFGSL